MAGFFTKRTFLSAALFTLFPWLLVSFIGFPYMEGKDPQLEMFWCEKQTNRSAHTNTHLSLSNYYNHEGKNISTVYFKRYKLLFARDVGQRRIQGANLCLPTPPPAPTHWHRQKGRCASQYIFQCGFLMEFDAVKNRALKRKSHSTSPFGIWTSADRLTFCLLFFSANF